MSRIMVLGYELPLLARGAIAACSYRTWQLVQPLLDDGHELLLCVPSTKPSGLVEHPLGERVAYRHLRYAGPGWMRQLNRWHDAFCPQGVLAVMYPNAVRATRLGTDAPIWIDLYGDRLVEEQLCLLSWGESSRGWYRQVREMTRILRLGDVFSTCGEPQRFSTIGQLAKAGRLNGHTIGYEFVHSILPGVGISQQPRASLADRKRLRQSAGLPTDSDAYVVLWCGGYNVWTDVETLFHGLEWAMKRRPDLQFLSVGGAANVPNNQTYDRFLNMIEQSAYRERFRMMGWVPASQVPDYYQLSDVGINVDAHCYETELGTRTRIVEMIGHSLPVITTLGCQLSAIIEERHLGMTCPIGDVRALGDCLVAMGESAQLRRELAQRARDYARERLAFDVTSSPLRAWARSPWHAPDKLVPTDSWIQKAVSIARFLARSMLWRFWGLERCD